MHPLIGDLLVNNKPAYVSREGLEKLRQELDEMVNVRRAEVATRIQEAKEHGDITENAEYEDAKNEQAFIEGRIQTLSALIKNAVIIDENHSTTHVQIGSTVELEGDGGREKYTIVGSAEASPADGRISNESPVGRALLGRKKGDKITVSVPAGDSVYKIVSIG
jgi:transcription elongation factor GreA